MKNLRIAFIDFWPEWPDEDFITPILSKHFNLTVDDENPDVVFHSIFGSNADSYHCKKVLFLGENKRYQNYNTNYSITFDPQTDTNFRLPLWQVFLLKKPELLERLFNRIHHIKFNNFCSFTVSNSNNFLRNSIYQQLNNYKKVKSYGRYMTNDQGLQKASKGKYWRDAKDKFFLKNTHKFSLAYENNMHPYYTTEKLMDTFLGGSLPIYWGDPKVTSDWNKEAFVNASRVPNVIQEIKRIDTDSAVFEEMYSQPVFTESQKEKLLENQENFKEWLIKIVKNEF